MNSQDKSLLKEKGISEEQVNNQLRRFDLGFPFLKISQAASVEYGILRLDDTQIQSAIHSWDNYLSNKHRIVKFVPASGAASRMFKDLFAFLEATYDEPTTSFEQSFFKGLKDFSFYTALNRVCEVQLEKSIVQLLDEKRYKDIVKMLLANEGLGYGQLPKGLLLFHKYGNNSRTAFEEHVVEGALDRKSTRLNSSH